MRRISSLFLTGAAPADAGAPRTKSPEAASRLRFERFAGLPAERLFCPPPGRASLFLVSHSGFYVALEKTLPTLYNRGRMI